MTRRDHPAGAADVSRWFPPYLILTAVVCGAAVMVVEVLGSRLIGPFFGVSLFVWTSLITVTLVALSAGYAAGGLLADRRGNPAWLYGIILTAGFMVLAVPLLKRPVITLCLPLGLRAGSLLASLALFGPSLLLLGAVSPYLVRIVAREVSSIGRTVGLLYAISTLGSFLGTVLTGFILIAYLGVGTIFRVVGVALVLLAAGYFVLFGRRRSFLALLAAAVLVVPRPAENVTVERPTGRSTRIHAADTFYGSLAVVDQEVGGGRVRELLIDGQIQGGVDLDNRLSVYEYSYFLEFLPRQANPGGRTCLVIGLGAGVVPSWYAAQGITTDVVDINPEVVTIARDYFGFTPTGDLIVADARRFLEETRQRYDYIVLDVFNGDTTPGHLLSLESFRLLAARLNPGGVVAINLVGSVRREPLMTFSVIRTLKEVFPAVRVFAAFPVDDAEAFGNLGIVAGGDLSPVGGWAIDPRQVHPDVYPRLARWLGNPYEVPAGAPSMILSDDFNPIDVRDLWLKEAHRAAILATTPAELLL